MKTTKRASRQGFRSGLSFRIFIKGSAAIFIYVVLLRTAFFPLSNMLNATISLVWIIKIIHCEKLNVYKHLTAVIWYPFWNNVLCYSKMDIISFLRYLCLFVFLFLTWQKIYFHSHILIFFKQFVFLPSLQQHDRE